jgi:two-component system, OmpR family, copper resistance phosphate regulon response regulator CusR
MVYLGGATRMRILLVEDDQEHAAIIARGLRKHAFAVDVAVDGDQALFFAETNDYDVVVLDLNLPKRDGFAVCRALREGGSHVPILMLTARDAVQDRVLGLETGADDYLVKPFDFAEFLARVRALLRRRQVYRGPVLTVGDLVLDTSNETVRRGERAIPLTSKEYALLEFLMRNANRVVRRAELAEHVWDNSFDAFSNIIDVYISRLRQKVDAGEPLPVIRTRRGVGYVISAEPEPAVDDSRAGDG